MVGARKLMKVLHHTRTFKGMASSADFKMEVPQKLKSENIEDAQAICRVCLQEGNIPIYGNEDFDDVSQDLNTIAGINVQKDDDHPKQLCVSCNSLLQSAIQLRKMAQYSDQVLQPCGVSLSNVKVEIDKSKFKTIDNDEKIKTLQAYKLKSKESVSPKEHNCKRCHIPFNTELQYRLHLLSDEHTNFKETCPICNQQYDPVYFKRHMIYHSTKVTHVCDVCGKEFTVKGHFEQHRRIHIPELPFKCSLCPYRSRFRHGLTIHRRTHTGEKPYVCPECPDRTFINKSNLSRHMLTHKADHDFTCDQCSRGFHFKLDLERHIKSTHLGIKDHICSICGKGFGLRNKLMKHRFKVHKIARAPRTGRMPLYLREEFQKQINPDESETKAAANFLSTSSASASHY